MTSFWEEEDKLEEEEDEEPELSFGREVTVEKFALELSSDEVKHVDNGNGTDGCSNMLNQGCWRHSVTVRRLLRTDKSCLLEKGTIHALYIRADAIDGVFSNNVWDAFTIVMSKR